MAEDNSNIFDYYNAEPPREGAVPPPKTAAACVPEDEFNEQVHDTVLPRRKGITTAIMLALSGLAVSFAAPGTGLIPETGDMPEESTVIESTVSESSNGGTQESAAATSAAATPTPAPTPTPVPLPTEDLRLKLDSFQMYPLDKGFLAEITFTLATNSGIKLSSITGAFDANLFKYDGYNAKTKKVKSHYEKYHQDFTVDSAKLVTGTGVSNTESQYTALIKVPADVTSEDKFSVTLTVSNTLNGEKTEDKTVSLKDINLWDEDSDTYVFKLVDSKTVKNGKAFELTVTPKDGVTITKYSVGSIDIFAKKGTGYLTFKDCKYTVEGNRITVTSKKKKIPSKGDFYITFFADFEKTDSTGTVFKGRLRSSSSLRY